MAASLSRGAFALFFVVATFPHATFATPSVPLRYHSGTTVPLTLGATALWIATEFRFKGPLSPDSCRWCDRSEGRDALNGWDASLRRKLLWEHPEVPRRWSDALLFVIVPATTLGSTWLAARADDRENEFGRDALLIAEAVGVSMSLNQIVKFTAGRQRPYVHFSKTPRPLDNDNNLSFYSGHATVTFTMATAAGTVASLRRYEGRALVWIPGVALATVTSYFRIACDRHYFTDVAAGVLIGSAVGIGLPRLLHGREDAPGGNGPSPGAPAFVIRWQW